MDVKPHLLLSLGGHSKQVGDERHCPGCLLSPRHAFSGLDKFPYMRYCFIYGKHLPGYYLH